MELWTGAPWSELPRCYGIGTTIIADRAYDSNVNTAFPTINSSASCQDYRRDALHNPQGSEAGYKAVDDLIERLGGQVAGKDFEEMSELKRGQYPRGSGGVESANKFICHVRMKRSGAWSYVINGNAMLRLRCSLYNGTFDEVFAKYKRRKRGPRKAATPVQAANKK